MIHLTRRRRTFSLKAVIKSLQRIKIERYYQTH